jgi:hypothetical protein
MRKTITIILSMIIILCLFPRGLVGMPDLHFKLGLSFNYYAVSDSIFKEIYGKGNLMFGGIVSIEPIRKVEIRLEANYFKDKGDMAVTGEELNFSIFSIVTGVRYLLFKENLLNPYLGVGIDFYNYKENYPERFEDVSESTTGYHGEGGIYLHLGCGFQIDFNIRYIKAAADPFDENIELGGLRAGASIEYRF